MSSSSTSVSQASKMKRQSGVKALVKNELKTSTYQTMLIVDTSLIRRLREGSKLLNSSFKSIFFFATGTKLNLFRQALHETSHVVKMTDPVACQLLQDIQPYFRLQNG